MWPFDRAPAAHIKREYTKPQGLGETFRRYATVAQMPRTHGVDPFREIGRENALRNGPFRISPIAQTSGPLPVNGHTGWDDRRRIWRFRACDAVTGKCVFEQYVESETPDGAIDAGRRELERHAREYGIKGSAALVGSILAV
jgi:hypothetical protein